MAHTPEFNASKTAETAFQSVDRRFPGTVTMQDANQVTDGLVRHARILNFVDPLVVNELHKIASKRK